MDGCDLPHAGLGFCDGHRQRVARTGEPGPADLSGHWTGDEATYIAVHIRLRKALGKARDKGCANCPRQADEWSYDHRDPDERVDELGRPFSVDLSHYRPLCRSCHRTEDVRFRRAVPA